jgi:hypothetical protein
MEASGLAYLSNTDMNYVALLKAIAEKLIPGIPEETRVAILQQTDASNNATETRESGGANSNSDGPGVLEDVIERATARQALQKEIDGWFLSFSGCFSI